MRGWGKKKQQAAEQEVGEGESVVAPLPEEEAPSIPGARQIVYRNAEGQEVSREDEVAGDAPQPETDAEETEEEVEEDDGARPDNDSGEEGEVCAESVRQMTEIEQEQKIAQDKGWHRLGRYFLEVTRPISDELNLTYAKSQCEALMEIEKIELEKKAANSDFKSRIESLQSIAIEAAKKFLHGEHVENGHFPAFFDPQTRERVYYDPAKDEEVKRMEARREDYQMRIETPDGAAAPAEGTAEATETPAEPSNETAEPNMETPPQTETEENGEVRRDQYREDDVGGGVSEAGEAQAEEARAS